MGIPESRNRVLGGEAEVFSERWQAVAVVYILYGGPSSCSVTVVVEMGSKERGTGKGGKVVPHQSSDAHRETSLEYNSQEENTWVS